MNARKGKKRGILKAVLTVMLSFAIVMGMIPGTDYVIPAHADGDKTISGLGTGAIADPTPGTGGWSYVYYGTYNSSPVKYRVLTNSTSEFGGTTMLLDCDSTLINKPHDSSSPYSNSWADSEINAWLNGNDFYNNSNVFTSQEKAAIAASSKSDFSNDGPGRTYLDPQNLNGEHVFLLDAKEATRESYGYASNAGDNATRVKSGSSSWWWLRSPYPHNVSSAGYVNTSGLIYYHFVGYDNNGVSPAFNINLSSVIFSSVISGNPGEAGAEYKLTVLDPDLVITQTRETEVTRDGNNVTVPYTISGDNAANSDRVSVILWKDSDAYTLGTACSDSDKYAYLKLDTSANNGTGTFTLPDEYESLTCGAEYHAYIVAEDTNDGVATDYASEPYEINGIKYLLTSDDLSITLPSDAVYDGTPKTATVQAASGVTGLGTVTVKYYDKNNSLLTGAPVEAGTYKVKVDVTASDSYAAVTDLTDDTWTFTISPKPVKVSGITASNKTYDATDTVTLNTNNVVFGESSTGGVVTENASGLIEPDLGKVSVSATGAFDDANVGTGKSITISNLLLSGEKAHNYSVDTTYSQNSTTADITKREASVTAVDQTVALKGNIDTSVSASTVTLSGAVSGHTVSEITLTGSDTSHVTDSGTITPGGAKISDAAGNDVTANYNITYENGKLTVTKGSVSYTAPVKKHLTYNGADQDLISAGSISSSEGAVMKYALGTDSTTEPASSSFDTAIPKTKDAGSYTVWYRIDGGSDYDDVAPQKITDIEISQKEVGFDWDVTTFDYDGNEHVATPKLTGVEDTDINSLGISVSGKERNAGTYTAKVTELTGTAKDNYKLPAEASCSHGFTIRKASLTVTAKDKSITYGEEPACDGVTYTGFVSGEDESKLTGTLTYSYDYEKYGDVGSYIITPSGLTSDNYDISFVNGTLTVNPKYLTFTWSATSTFAYDGSPKMVTATADTINSDIVTLSYTDNEKTDAGEYVAKVTGISGDKAGNYRLEDSEKSASHSWSISKVLAVISSKPEAKSLTYNAQAQTLVTEGSYDGGELVYAVTTGNEVPPQSSFEITLPARTNAGTYNVYFKVKGDKNHTDSAIDHVTVSIKRASITPKVTMSNWRVGSEPSTPIVSDNPGNGTVTCEYKKAKEPDSAYTTNPPMVAGSYVVKATVAETENYLSGTATCEYKILPKKTETVTGGDDDGSGSGNGDGSEDFYDYLDELRRLIREASKKPGPQTVEWNKGISLPYDIIKMLQDNPNVTVKFSYNYLGVNYTAYIGGGNASTNILIPWYGPLYLNTYYGSQNGKQPINAFGSRYVVQRGDCLWKIARRTGTKVNDLVKLNNITNPNLIRPGQVLNY